MEQGFTGILKLFFESLLAGFAIIIPIVALIKTSNLKTLQFKDLFIIQAVQLVRLSGIFYAMLHIPDVYSVYFSAASLTNGSTVGITFPVSYQLFLFYPPAMYLILTQLFWIKKLYFKKASLITLSLILLILPSRNFVAVITALQGEDPTIAFALFKSELFIRLALNAVIFFFTTFALMVLSGKLKNVADK